MEYSITGNSSHSGLASITAKSNEYTFGIKPNAPDTAGPAELLLGSFAACCLKNVERFSKLLGYSYDEAKIEVKGIRQEKPPMFKSIHYALTIKSDDSKLSTDLLQKNLVKFGTIYNTLNAVCEIDGKILISNV
jgi:uncharacterized OsmC-like protein